MSSPPPLVTVTAARIDQAGQTLLRGLNVSIPRASLTVITGANGSGKSTLLSVLAGLRFLDDGELMIADGVRRAFVPQRSEASDALPLTVADVVEMGRWFRPKERNRAEDRALVATAIAAVGVQGLEKRSLGELSGGQRQRAFLAQGLAQRADLLLLDEPTTGLDEEGHAHLRTCIDAERARGAAVVLVTHDPNGVRDATQRVHLTDGRAVITPCRPHPNAQ
ncbi:zinc/manganese transport system ATP-binding protein [Okibacterium sp. HSC-33S16]|uniref:zinc ABC transporter ATP-binding protein AztA n=1 Tax=Okibacterium sp. HSC-33S16 TaxID=2910965 RepID=UPI00209E8EEE|nr:zinc ABC transporter ATP-binding protein AztA [Okibacterium sp. HSC-33S16]MCP2032164.1 zinc/manganese transport system ATP-binding protein [Okibacterium sp. HSC-33S16]